MNRIARVFSVFSIAVVGTAPSLAPASAQERLNTVTVAAQKRVDVEADVGRASFGIRTEDVSAKAATAELSQRIDSVLKALRDAGFTNDELATGAVRLNRQCIDRCIDPNPRDNIPPDRLMGYVGNAVVFVDTSRLNKLGEAVDAAITGGANSIRGISYDVEDKDEAVLVALRQAMRLAKAKAQVIAEESGRTLGPAIIVTEGRTSAPVAYDLVEADNALGASIGSGSSASESIPFPVEPPTLSASARVTVVWELI